MAVTTATRPLRTALPAWLKGVAATLLPSRGYAALRRWWHRPTPVNFGSLRCTEPVSRSFGGDRGTPICRHYIAQFIAAHRDDIRGDVMEIAEPLYARRFGDGVCSVDVLHVEPGNPHATRIGNLETGQNMPTAAYDCVILTQTLPFIFDVHAAVRHCFAALKPGGVVLATVPGICPISRFDMDRWGDYWRFTPLSAATLFARAFGDRHVDVTTFGNALAATAYVQGIAADELAADELAHADEDYPVTIAVRAVKLAEADAPC